MAEAEEVGLLEGASSLSAALSARTATLEQELVLSPAFAATAARTPAEAAAQPSVRRALYASHFLSTWGQRGWEFSIGLIMLKLHPTSLLLVSVFGLLDAAVSVVFGASVGQWVDRTDRLLAAQRMYLLQNSMVALSAFTALVLLWTGARAGPLYWACLLATLAGGSLSTLGALGSTLSVEREWTRVLCQGDSGELARINAAMKRIDLTCLIASPIAVGLVMTFGGREPMAAATLVLLAWNMVAWAPECWLLSFAQRRSAALQQPKEPAQGGKAAGAGGGDAGGGGGGGGGSGGGSWRRHLGSWRAYFGQPVAPAALALALLYFTVLSFGSLMTAYLAWLGMPEAELSVYRGLGAVSGLAATVTFPPCQRCAGLVATGVASIYAQLACVLAATAPSVTRALGAGAVGAAAARYALVAGLVLSRFGLWSFDLSANQLIQEMVPPGQLGAVNGVQGSLQSFFQMLAYALGVVVWQPERFPFLMASSCACVAAAAALFTAWATRGAGGGPRLRMDVSLEAGSGDGGVR